VLVKGRVALTGEPTQIREDPQLQDLYVGEAAAPAPGAAE
jgi:ABC-type branched-subunit amino acid transport system ATPase component